jgi:hypothetical protein
MCIEDGELVTMTEAAGALAMTSRRETEATNREDSIKSELQNSNGASPNSDQRCGTGCRLDRRHLRLVSWVEEETENKIKRKLFGDNPNWWSSLLEMATCRTFSPIANANHQPLRGQPMRKLRGSIGQWSLFPAAIRPKATS